MSDFHLYYHDDLDGTASGAVFLDFFRKRGDDIVSFIPLEYNTKLDAYPKAWEEYQFQNPSILVDFQYHPKANWWIDHHQSAFKDSAWQSAFRQDDQHHWDPKAPSACGLVARFLQGHHGYILSDAVKSFIAVVDVDDSAGYPTLEAALELESPSKQIQLLLGDTELKKDHGQYLKLREFFIKNYISLSMEKIVAVPEYRERIVELRDRRLHADEALIRLAELKGNVVWIDKGDQLSHASRWAPYLAYPEAPYSVQLRDKGGEFKIGIGSNKWSEERSTIDLGGLARKYGGGGHKGVGALFVKSRDEALRIANEIIDFLNTNHLIT